MKKLDMAVPLTFFWENNKMQNKNKYSFKQGDFNYIFVRHFYHQYIYMFYFLLKIVKQRQILSRNATGQYLSYSPVA